MTKPAGRVRTPVPVKKGDENLTDAQRSFLAAFREMGVIRRACKVAEVGRQTHYDWMESNPEYRRAFEAAQEDAADSLEAEVYRRAVKGVRKPVGWYKGVAGGYVREYSDLLLMFRLKALRPEKYRERVEVRGVYAHIDLNRLADEQLARISAGEDPLFVVSTPAEPVAALPPAVSDDTGSPPDRQGTLRAITYGAALVVLGFITVVRQLCPLPAIHPANQRFHITDATTAFGVRVSRGRTALAGLCTWRHRWH